MVTAESLHENLKHIKIGSATCLYTLEKCAEIAPLINQINELKKEKKAVILAHSYVSPDIIHGVADFVGDSYELSKFAQSQKEATTIVFSAVKFMAETAKIVNPNKTVLVPNKLNGCSLADSITGQDVRDLKKAHPDYTFICYINTSAEVKAECDVCVTSSNVYDIVIRHPNNNIYFLPDRLMGENLINELNKRGVSKSIKIYKPGTCYVHEDYDPELIDYIRLQYKDVDVLSHPECSPDVLKNSDYVGSTSQMINHVKTSNKSTFFILTECGLVSRLQLEQPQKTFVGSCTMCKYMKSNQLEDILRVLTHPDPEDIITLDESVIKKATKCIENMFYYANLLS